MNFGIEKSPSKITSWLSFELYFIRCDIRALYFIPRFKLLNDVKYIGLSSLSTPISALRFGHFTWLT